MIRQEFVDRVFRESGVLPAPKVILRGSKVSAHLTAGPDQLWSPDSRQVSFYDPVLTLFERARLVLGLPIGVNAGYRTVAYQENLELRGYKTARFVSPHNLAAALDLKDLRKASSRDPVEANGELREAVYEAARQLNLPGPRVGHRVYRERFCHVDLVFMLFEPYAFLPHPAGWDELPREWRDYVDINWRPGVSW